MGEVRDGNNDLHERSGRPKVLEVRQEWGDVLLDVRHFDQVQGRDIGVGSSVGYRWSLLGIDMGWIPSSLRGVLPWAPPIWSEVRSELRGDFYADTGEDDRVLLRHEDGRYVAVADPAWSLERDGSASAADVPIDDDTVLVATAGDVRFTARQVAPGARSVDRARAAVDFPFVSLLSTGGFLAMLFGLVVATTPRPPEASVVELPPSFAQVFLDPPEKKEARQERRQKRKEQSEAAKAKRDEGKRGKRDARRDRSRGTRVEVEKQRLDRQIAEEAGVLGAMEGLDAVFGSSALDLDVTSGVGGLLGAKGHQIGRNGLGTRGGSLGGGGSAESLGGLRTRGPATGTLGFGGPPGEGKRPGTIGHPTGEVIVVGALDRAVIDEVIKRHMAQIRYCYQRQLQRTPNLGGKTVVKFAISGSGSVSHSSIKSSTLNSAAVESCVQKRFLRMDFPAPRGNGIVVVSYPLLFTPG